MDAENTLGTDLPTTDNFVDQVDVSTLIAGALLSIELDNGGYLTLEVHDPATGEVIIHRDGSNDLVATLSVPLVAVDEEITVNGEPTPRRIKSIAVANQPCVTIGFSFGEDVTGGAAAELLTMLRGAGFPVIPHMVSPTA